MRPLPSTVPARRVSARRNAGFCWSSRRRPSKEAVTTGQLADLKTDGLAQKFFQAKGCFVTLTEHGELRGCVGHVVSQEPLYLAIADSARGAATQDPRFCPVQREELASIEIEISVLTAPEPVFFISSADLLAKLRPDQDGVVLRMGDRSATFLPQVWEQIPDKVDFLDTLSEKAGCAPGAWRKLGTTVSVYQVESFKETD